MLWSALLTELGFVLGIAALLCPLLCWPELRRYWPQFSRSDK